VFQTSNSYRHSGSPLPAKRCNGNGDRKGCEDRPIDLAFRIQLKPILHAHEAIPLFRSVAGVEAPSHELINELPSGTVASFLKPSRARPSVSALSSAHLWPRATSAAASDSRRTVARSSCRRAVLASPGGSDDLRTCGGKSR
jgi:hypothetical protein